MTNTEKRVIRAAMLMWKYEPVDSRQVRHTKRFQNLMRACDLAALSKTRKRGKR